MSNKISKKRKAIYYIGLVLIIIGIILFISNFFIDIESDFVEGPSSFIRRPLIGMVFITIGNILMSIGAKGTAGSGLILDPEKAREDLKPYSAAKGRMINDTIENIDMAKDMAESKGESQVKEIIKIKCKNCGTLNDEDAIFCKSCGKKI
ncbi:zinc ribbon domain-containing protein [Anaerosalibacter massiliensis]|uniref:Zinc ribbon domain-containing protein n=1 Tax=Anaerosalibacter massiliensis TaxID=1347392 RepID=A0A9X2MDJ2_9FIRM|nr:zinc ribbon domain-containing protein [Anaerosalibacter massiliensis]MCR2043027.1 zinc ribbon domain-containing protein [Anaerosalibacter massiliensis]